MWLHNYQCARYCTVLYCTVQKENDLKQLEHEAISKAQSTSTCAKHNSSWRKTKLRQSSRLVLLCACQHMLAWIECNQLQLAATECNQLQLAANTTQAGKRRNWDKSHVIRAWMHTTRCSHLSNETRDALHAYSYYSLKRVYSLRCLWYLAVVSVIRSYAITLHGINACGYDAKHDHLRFSTITRDVTALIHSINVLFPHMTSCYLARGF